jgi:hypothetical protein
MHGIAQILHTDVIHSGIPFKATTLDIWGEFP